MSIRIGTRGSKLALLQTGIVAKKLADLGIGTEQVIIHTAGDATTQVPLHEIGGQGVFVRALDDAILAGEIDCAVHSMKDIPAYRPSGLITAAILKRDSAADFIAYRGSLSAVKVVGTSSTRRCAQLLRHDPSVTVRDLRGNVDTRIRKLGSGEYDAIILAEAGLTRMGIRIQGEQLGGGCFTPLGIYCRSGHLIAEVLSLDGTRGERIEMDVKTIDEAREHGRQLRARAQGLIDEAYKQLGIAGGQS